MSNFRLVMTGDPQGAGLNPLLFNLMHFPIPPKNIKNFLFVDDITIYTMVKKADISGNNNAAVFRRYWTLRARMEFQLSGGKLL